jgi:hypothetical protein
MPTGVFIPALVIGAAIGRLTGELMVCLFPNGMRDDEFGTRINPGVYAVAGMSKNEIAEIHLEKNRRCCILWRRHTHNFRGGNHV